MSSGEADGKCGAKKTGGGTCKHVAGHGTNHVGVGRCKFHGGSSPAGEKHGARLLAKRGLLWYGDPDTDIEPTEALLQEVRRTQGHVYFLEEEVATFAADGWPKDEDERLTFERKLDSLQELYHTEREHLVKVCQVALNAGVEERRVKLAERQGELIARVIQGVLKDLDIEDLPGARQAVRRNLRLVAADGELLEDAA